MSTKPKEMKKKRKKRRPFTHKKVKSPAVLKRMADQAARSSGMKSVNDITDTDVPSSVKNTDVTPNIPPQAIKSTEQMHRGEKVLKTRIPPQ